MSDDAAKILLGDTAISATEQQRGIFRRRRKDRQLHAPPPFTHCENCGARLHGHWCAQCGQPAVDYRRSFRHVIVDLLESFLNWDSKFFTTIGLLVTRPWRLTNAFLAGQRVRYLHPARLYLLASITFFFAATYAIKSVHINPLNLSAKDRTEIRNELQAENVPSEVLAAVDQAFGSVPVSSKKRAALEEILKNKDLPQATRDSIQYRLEHGDPPEDARTKLEDAMKNMPPEARSKLEETLKKHEGGVIFDDGNPQKKDKIDNWLEKRAHEKFGTHGSNIQLFLVTLMSNLPYMMLACIPLFALVLKILYVRRRIFYIDHLVYAFHIHSFAFLMIMLNVLITIGLNRAIPGVFAGLVIAALWTTFAVQIFLSIRRVYRQGWFFSVFKFFLGGIAYLTVLLVALAITFLITLATP